MEMRKRAGIILLVAAALVSLAAAGQVTREEFDQLAAKHRNLEARIVRLEQWATAASAVDAERMAKAAAPTPKAVAPKAAPQAAAPKALDLRSTTAWLKLLSLRMEPRGTRGRVEVSGQIEYTGDPTWEVAHLGVVLYTASGGSEHDGFIIRDLYPGTKRNFEVDMKGFSPATVVRAVVSFSSWRSVQKRD